MSEKRGTSSSRSRAHANRPSEEATDPPKVNLKDEMMFQRATQQIAERYEDQIRQLRKMHEREMNSMLEGMADSLTSKPSLWARLTRRYKDI